MREVGEIGNYYGELCVKEDNDRFFWSIENHDGHCWQEIPLDLYVRLLQYADESDKGLWKFEDSL